MSEFDTVDRPRHYNIHPSGIQCVEISRHMTSALGQAFQYGWRYYAKANPLEDLRKMLWWIRDQRENSAVFLVCDPAFRNFFELHVMAPRKHIFNRPSPWCESVRHAMACICDFHRTANSTERNRLLAKAERCLLTAIGDEECLSQAEGAAIL